MVPLTHEPGVYSILCTTNSKCYVGRTSDLYRRKREHFKLLSEGRHYNPNLQSCWNLYGPDSLVFEVLDYGSIEELAILEQHYMDEYRDCLMNTVLQPFAL